MAWNARIPQDQLPMVRRCSTTLRRVRPSTTFSRVSRKSRESGRSPFEEAKERPDCGPLPVRVFLDGCVMAIVSRPARSRVKTAHQMGCLQSRTANSSRRKLSRRIRDRESQSVLQQNLTIGAIAIVVLQAKTNRLGDLMPCVPALMRAIETARPGTVQTVVST